MNASFLKGHWLVPCAFHCQDKLFESQEIQHVFLILNTRQYTALAPFVISYTFWEKVFSRRRLSRALTPLRLIEQWQARVKYFWVECRLSGVRFVQCFYLLVFMTATPPVIRISGTDVIRSNRKFKHV